MKNFKKIVLILMVSIPMMSIALHPLSLQQEQDLEYVNALKAQLDASKGKLSKLRPWNIAGKNALKEKINDLKWKIDDVVSFSGLESYI